MDFKYESVHIQYTHTNAAVYICNDDISVSF